MKRILYFGLDPERFKSTGLVTHYPLIGIQPRSLQDPHVRLALEKWNQFTHILFTSRSAVISTIDCLNQIGKRDQLMQKKLIAIGAATAQLLPGDTCQAQLATAEGVVDLLKGMPQGSHFFFFPHSSLSRPVIVDFLEKEGLQYCACIFYDTFFQAPEPRPSFEEYDEFVFTSPSTVEAFVTLIGPLPRNKKLTAIGPITEKVVTKFLDCPSVVPIKQ